MEPTPRTQSASAPTVSPALGEAQHHRCEFGISIEALEDWLSTPVEPGFARELAKRVAELEEYLVEHIALVENPKGGLFAEIVAMAPRLTHAVQQLREDHPRLAERARTARALAGALADPPAEEAASAAVEAAQSLIEALRAHRQRGAHVVYEAYAFDLGDAD